MIYFIADTHFDHTNIIKYCNRPFRNVQAMNKALVSNWNRTVKPSDTVFFLGDWSFGRDSRPASYWIKQLNGNIITIKGSHDIGVRARNSQIINCGFLKFLLIHDPGQVPKDWKGWVIHGHKHNNEVGFPFINGRNKTINVSVEVISYKPLSLDKLVSLDIDSIARMETVNSKAERVLRRRDTSKYRAVPKHTRPFPANHSLQIAVGRR